MKKEIATVPGGPSSAESGGKTDSLRGNNQAQEKKERGLEVTRSTKERARSLCLDPNETDFLPPKLLGCKGGHLSIDPYVPSIRLVHPFPTRKKELIIRVVTSPEGHDECRALRSALESRAQSWSNRLLKRFKLGNHTALMLNRTACSLLGQESTG